MKKNFGKVSGEGGGKLTAIVQFALFLFTAPGFKLIKKIIKRAFTKAGFFREHKISYNNWVKARKNIAVLRTEYETSASLLTNKPVISILLFADHPENDSLSSAVNSVVDQLYPHWQLYIVCKTALPPLQSDARIHHITSDVNIALPQLTDYILYLDNHHILSPDYLFKITEHAFAHPLADIIYSDEDILDDKNGYTTPFFKPDWSPDRMLSHNYIGGVFAIKKDLLLQSGGFQNNEERAYDLLLRATELTNQIGHIPDILFHKLGHTTNTNNDSLKQCIDAALQRREVVGSAMPVIKRSGYFNIRYEIAQYDKVSIIIPTRDNTALLKQTLETIFTNTTYPDFEVIVLNNNSISKDFFSLIDAYKEQYKKSFSCVDASFPFNFSKLMNLGVSLSNGAYILLLNNDMQIIHSDWLTQMVAQAQQKNTGAVGVKLLYPDNTIQHAGIILGINNDAAHAFINSPADADGYFNCLKTTVNYSALTGACFMLRKELFIEAGGMDEALPVEYNDIDLCLKVSQRGYYNVFLSSVVLYHYESATRGHPFRSTKAWQQHEKDYNTFKNKWSKVLHNDPFYNPNLTKTNTDFRSGLTM